MFGIQKGLILIEKKRGSVENFLGTEGMHFAMLLFREIYF
jgi:hypothetical protein